MSLRKEIILSEITGKNAAVNAYDNIIWMIRTGYFTLLYGGWAIVLNSLIDRGGNIDKHIDVLIIMLAVTLGLVAGAYLVDQNYLSRKFRVILSLNVILRCSFDNPDLDSIGGDAKDDLRHHLKVSGDTFEKDKDDDYKTDGYYKAEKAERIIYGFSVLPIVMALIYLHI